MQQPLPLAFDPRPIPNYNSACSAECPSHFRPPRSTSKLRPRPRTAELYYPLGPFCADRRRCRAMAGQPPRDVWLRVRPPPLAPLPAGCAPRLALRSPRSATEPSRGARANKTHCQLHIVHRRCRHAPTAVEPARCARESRSPRPCCRLLSPLARPPTFAPPPTHAHPCTPRPTRCVPRCCDVDPLQLRQLVRCVQGGCRTSSCTPGCCRALTRAPGTRDADDARTATAQPFAFLL